LSPSAPSARSPSDPRESPRQDAVAFNATRNTVAHIAEALWMQALEDRRRAVLEQRDSARLAELDKQRLEIRSHVLTLREGEGEGELDSRLHDRDRTIEDLNLRPRELAFLLRKEQATRELLTLQLAQMRF
jgi:hypothetical protein